MDNIDTIVKRVKKLLNLAKGKGASEAEASLAMQRAQEMLVKYKLCIGDVQDTELYKKEPIQEFNITIPLSDHLWSAYVGKLLGAVAKNCFCRAFKWQAHAGASTKFTRVCLVGKESDVEICKAQFNYIYGQIQSMSSYFTDDTGREDDVLYSPRGRAVTKQKTDYACGIAERVTERLREMRKKLETGIDTNALVVLEDKAVDQFLTKFRWVSQRGSGYSPVQSAFSKGREAGNTVQLNRQVK